MSSPIDDGGPAVPFYDGRGGVPGMTLRDYFAGQALVGPCADGGQIKSVVKCCYDIADAMIAARKEVQP